VNVTVHINITKEWMAMDGVGAIDGERTAEECVCKWKRVAGLRKNASCYKSSKATMFE